MIQPPEMIEYLTAVRHRLRFIVAAAVLGALLIGGLTALLREPKVQVASSSLFDYRVL